jgi:anti-sigma-K factor RskA
MNNTCEGGAVQGPDDALAVDFILGTLNEADRIRVENRLTADAAFAERVAAWRQRLQPLAEPIAPVAPPDDAWDRIAARIAKTQP